MLEWSRTNPGVVAGRYRAKHEAIDYVGILDNEWPYPNDDADKACMKPKRFHRALYAGTGFMLIPRPVLERLIAIYPVRIFFDICPGHEGRLRFFRAYD
jgi:hypothetical protein